MRLLEIIHFARTGRRVFGKRHSDFTPKFRNLPFRFALQSSAQKRLPRHFIAHALVAQTPAEFGFIRYVYTLEIHEDEGFGLFYGFLQVLDHFCFS